MTAESRSASEPGAIAAAADSLRRGGIVAIPTETVYGLAAVPQAGPLERLVAIKRRSADKGIALLIDSADQLHDYATVPPVAMQLARAFWPGPLTLVLDIRQDLDVPRLLTGGRPTIALRLPDHEVPRELCRRLGPFAASSANISGQPDATSAAQVLATLRDDVDLILDDGPTRAGLASTVVAVPAGDSPPVVLREGAIPAARIADASRLRHRT